MQPIRKVNPAVTALIVIVLIAVVVGAVVVINNTTKTNTEQSVTQDTQTPTTAETTSEPDATASYKDGTYTETGSYSSPGGRESIEVTVTLANDIITAASVKGDATSGESKEHQEDFISGYKTLVVGKDIDTVSLSRVAGSSLTSNGFNTALKLIKVDAGA